MAQLAPDELKAKLTAGEPLQVVDIRESPEYSAWHISGAANLPVYDALRGGDAKPLIEAAAELARDRPVVTVCRAGILSERAASVLTELGFEVLSLSGGMRGWGSVWSEAPITEIPGATFLQLRRNGKGCLSYLFGAHGDAAVVDPSVDVEAYLHAAETAGLTISHVLETHVHADHLSRARELCRASGATLVLPPNGRATYPFRPIADGERLEIGGMTVEAIATPGHTGESTCYLVDGKVLLTGDTLFVNAVGRPDLEKGDAGAVAGAHALFASLRERLLGRFEDVAYFPCHHGSPIGFEATPVGSTLARARREVDLLGSDEEAFVGQVVSSLRSKPGNFETIIAVNEGRLENDSFDPLELEAGPNCCAAG